MLETQEQQQMDLQHQAGDGPPPAVVKVRWKPSEEQLRMLVRLFEEEGDSINKQRIKEIAVDLARQGEVTEANVHNWFHNRKARAKRKQKMIQMNDGESEVDTDDVDSKGKRTKLEQHHSHAVSVNGSAGFAVPEFADQRAFMLRSSSLTLPSDAVNLSSRMFYDSSMALPAHPSLQANECGGDKYRLSAELSPDLAHSQAEPQAAADAWKSQALTLYTPSFNHRMSSPVDSMNRSSESKTITDDASTESEDMVDSSRRWKKSSRRKGKGTMIRRPFERTGNGRSRHTSGRKTRIREVLKSLKRNSENYDRDLKALFVEVVTRLGAGRARSILSRITSRSESSSPSPSFGSGSRSSTASPVRRRVVSSSPNSHHWLPAAGERQRFYHKVQTDLSRCAQHCCNRASYVAVATNSTRNLALSSEDDDDDGSSPRGHAGGDEDETDVDKEDFRIVWSSQKKQDAEKLFTSPLLSSEIKDEDASTCRTNLVVQQEPATNKKEKQLATAVGAKSKLELAPEGEKTTIVLSDGKPTGPAGTWWNSMLRHSALLFLDISIPHIALQPEEGLVRIREYMDSKFEYSGGTLDDAYLKKQVAKSLNFRRHKVMRLIEQGAGRPSDVSEDQWDALIKYYADPKRREKSDKQRAALKALNMNNQLHQQQQMQLMQARQQQQQQQQQQQMQQQQQVQRQVPQQVQQQPQPQQPQQRQQQQEQQEGKHFVRDLNVQQVEEQEELGQVAVLGEQDNED